MENSTFKLVGNYTHYVCCCFGFCFCLFFSLSDAFCFMLSIRIQANAHAFWKYINASKFTHILKCVCARERIEIIKSLNMINNITLMFIALIVKLAFACEICHASCIRFHAICSSNLSNEHLDFTGEKNSMENICACKLYLPLCKNTKWRYRAATTALHSHAPSRPDYAPFA